MSSQVRFQVLYRRAGIAVGSWSCNCPGTELSPLEYSPHYEVVFLRSGAFVKHQGQRRAFGDPNHVVFFNAGEEYRVRHPPPGGDRCTVFSLGPSALSRLIDRDEGRGRGAPALPAKSAVIDSVSYAAHRQVLRQLQQPDGADPATLEELVIALLRRVLGAVSLPPTGRGSDRLAGRRARRRAAEAVQELLAARFCEPLTLDDVARETSYSKYYLARVFRGETGLPIHRYLNRLRLRAALERVIDPSIDLSRLALQLGFSSHSHFSNAFRREFGFPPSAFRGKAFTRVLPQLVSNLQA